MTKITENEHKVLRSLLTNQFEGGVWSWAIDSSSEPSRIAPKSLSGVISSLVKKKLVTSEWYSANESAIYLTDEGRKLAEEIGKFNK